MRKLYWFTGQAGAGKTELATMLKKHLIREQTILNQNNEYNGLTGSLIPNKKFVIIDGDDIRALYNNSDYSIEGRKKNVDFIQNLCVFLMRNDITPIVCMVSPFALQRRFFIEEYKGIEIFVHCNEIRGRENFHVDYYEPPLIDFKYSIESDTTNNTISESFNILIENLCKITL
jgi:adenylylsulfate kinase-like enzyme